MSGEHSNLGAWIRPLRETKPPLDRSVRIDALDQGALDSAVGFAAEHTRRYVATNGADDGWDGPRPIVILYTTGRRSGTLRRNPVLAFEHAGRRYVIGSKGGAGTHPQWYLNLCDDPRVHVRVGADVYPATARTVVGQDRSALWTELVSRFPMFGDYQGATTRQIPIVDVTS